MFRTRRRAVILLSRSAAAAALAFVPAARLAARSELVVHKEGTKLYHRPGCPVIRDGANVLALTRAQAESRGYTSHPECDPATAKAPSESKGRTEAQPGVTVYVEGPTYYHRKSCPKLAAASNPPKAQPLETALKTHWPCPTCKAPVFKKTVDAPVLGTTRRRGG
jgi:hypothetical protein